MELDLETYSYFLFMCFHISFTISCPLAGPLSGVLSFCVTGGVRWGMEHSSSDSLPLRKVRSKERRNGQSSLDQLGSGSQKASCPPYSLPPPDLGAL